MGPKTGRGGCSSSTLTSTIPTVPSSQLNRDPYLICAYPEQPVQTRIEILRGKAIEYCDYVMNNGSCRLQIQRARRLTRGAV